MPGQPPDNLDPFAGVPERVAELVVRYYDAWLAEAEQAELRAALKTSASARDLFARWGLQVQALGEALAPQYSETDDPVSFEQLARMEAQAQAELVERPGKAKPIKPARSGKADNPSAKEVADALWYLGRRPVVWGPIAAVLAVALALLVVFTGGDEEPERTAGQNKPISEPGRVGTDKPATVSIVATLTAERDAVWAPQPVGDLRPGAPLAAGPRLTLTQGFAEITTEEGAVVILEAPATIELIDSPNAIKLHTGKLVGICETESSKGFVVHAPQMTIVDLGTRFGVDAISGDITRVTVFRGSVSVSSPTNQDVIGTTSATPTLLVGSGQSVESDPDQAEFRRVAYNSSHFDAFGRRPIPLTGTGAGQSVGDIDPRWQIVAVNGQRLDQPQTLRVFRQPEQFAREHPNDPNTSQWLAWLPPLDQQRIGPTYRFQSTLALPEPLETQDRQLVGRFMVDHRVVAVRVNGRPVSVPPQNPLGGGWHTNVYDIVIDTNILRDENIIEFDVRNDIEGSKNYVGFRVAWELQTLATIRSRTTTP
ncbi:MAG: FecR family protein [Planctomycetota bacterium]